MGQTDGTVKVSAEYKNVELVGIYAGKTLHHTIKGEYRGTYIGYHFGLFYTPVLAEWGHFTIEGGPGFWHRRFPTNEGQRFHLSLSLSYGVTDSVSLTYSHMSNGFGLLNRLNPGLDNIGLTINFN